METRARISDISRDFESGKIKITFTCDNAESEELSELQKKDIRLRAVRWHEKRSLNSNAYFHVLKTKLAQKMDVSNTNMHNHLISEYGFPDVEIGHLIMKDEIEWKEIDSIHLRPTTQVKTLDNGSLYRVYIVMRGSHTYNVEEMQRLISGAVEEAKALGIETATPDELERMQELWAREVEKRAS
jgi:hypothetical protein